MDIYSTWSDNGRLKPNVTVSYSLKAAPSVFVALTTVNYNPVNMYSAAGLWVKSGIAVPSNISGMAALKFDFPAQDNGYVGYNEIDVFGAPKTLTSVHNANAQALLLYPNPVMNQLGQRVKMIATKQLLPGGLHKLEWDGTNAGNGEVAPGIYHVRIVIDDSIVHRKIVLSK